jgi:hypothetical protein
MKLTSLELDKKEAKAESFEAQDSELPKYPYGTCLYLDEVALAKLGITTMPAVGTAVQIIAVGKVTGTSSREYEGGAHQTLDIQLTEMSCACDAGDTPMGKAAKKLYPNQA